jgi:hypothetical protein
VSRSMPEVGVEEIVDVEKWSREKEVDGEGDFV